MARCRPCGPDAAAGARRPPPQPDTRRASRRSPRAMSRTPPSGAPHLAQKLAVARDSNGAVGCADGPLAAVPSDLLEVDPALVRVADGRGQSVRVAGRHDDAAAGLPDERRCLTRVL